MNWMILSAPGTGVAITTDAIAYLIGGATILFAVYLAVTNKSAVLTDDERRHQETIRDEIETLRQSDPLTVDEDGTVTDDLPIETPPAEQPDGPRFASVLQRGRGDVEVRCGSVTDDEEDTIYIADVSRVGEAIPLIPTDTRWSYASRDPETIRDIINDVLPVIATGGTPAPRFSEYYFSEIWEGRVDESDAHSTLRGDIESRFLSNLQREESISTDEMDERMIQDFRYPEETYHKVIRDLERFRTIRVYGGEYHFGRTWTNNPG